MPAGTIHQGRENCKVALQFMPNRLVKTPVSLYKSCRGMLDLQLCLLHLGALQFKFLLFHSVKQGYLKCFAGARRSPSHAARRQRATPCAAAGDPRRGLGTNVEVPRAPRSKHRGIGRRSHCHSDRLPLRHALRVHGPTTLTIAARPTASPPYSARARRHAVPHTVNVPMTGPCANRLSTRLPIKDAELHSSRDTTDHQAASASPLASYAELPCWPNFPAAQPPRCFT
jgi:hypothetical protein